MAAPSSFLDEIRWRGLLHQATDEAGLRDWLKDPSQSRRRGYVGFDPTADSLTIGNLVPIMLMRHFQRAGHQPVVVMGGGTGLIGDPSGKSAERTLMTREQVEANVQGQRRIFERLLELAPAGREGASSGAIMTNNLDWLGKLGFLEVLRDIGKHFSVNMMIQKESVRERLHNRDQGISYTEFSYMILQAYDFWHLFKEVGVTVQMGGSDQWGNIVAGLDLIRRLEFAEPGFAEAEAERQRRGLPPGAAIAVMTRLREPQAFGLTVPLITKADGGKFGKTETGAIWLTADRTSPYAYYQFWRNASDADVIRFLKIFTILPKEEIDALAATHAANPGAAEAQKVLAREATALLHGQTEAAHAERAAQALFSGELAGLPEATLQEVFASAPTTEHDRAQLRGEGLPILDLLAQTTLVKSKSEARQFLQSGAVSINGRAIEHTHRVTDSDLLHGKLIALRRGKKAWHLTRWK
jgi:tyrosyl-tRNA synthetase